MADYASAIASIESAGERNPYTALGPPVKGDQAHGKYQVMGANIGPWSKEILGQELTPEQFLASPQAQDAIFQGKFGQYVQQYGPEGAAQAWFAGPGGVGKLDRKDPLGTSVGSYGQRFMAALGPNSPSLPPGGPPVPVLSQGMPAYGWTPNNAPAGLSEAPHPPDPLADFGQPPPLPPPLQLKPRPASPGFRFFKGMR